MKHKNGQALLILILFIAIVLTVVLSISFKTRVDTQLSALEQQNQQALAAAEAAIESALQQDSDVTLGSGTLSGLTGFTGQATISTNTTNSFVTPLLQADEQYTFYLVTYTAVPSPTPPSASLGTDYYTNNLTFYFGTGSSYDCSSRTTPALELAFVLADNTVNRQLLEPCSSGRTIGTSSVSVSGASGSMPENIPFTYQATVTPPAQAKFVIIRNLFSETKLAIVGAVTLKPQGKYVDAQAKIPNGADKKVRLFQSYPQIPAEFFVTQF